MTYRVEIAHRAARDLEILFVEKQAAESQTAARWYNGLEVAVCTLAQHPRRGSKSPEAKKLKRDIRHLLYGNEPHVYRIIYEIDERRQTVSVLTIRQGARRQLKPSDLG